ncbi:MAG: hypothetical protein JWM09_592 [Francisellaceae bacterium]|nr:hypothetical protein [Francisellaceae bacterium]
MKRIVITLANAEKIKKVVEILNKENIPKEKLYLIAKYSPDWPDDIFLANNADLEALRKGITIGTLITLAGLPVLAFTSGILLATGTILSTAILGSSLIQWLTYLLTSASENEIESYETDVEKGKMLIITDIPNNKLKNIDKEIKEHNAQIKIS